MSAPDVPAVPDALVGERVRLRPPTEDDVQAIWEHQDWEGARLGDGGAPVPHPRSATEEHFLRPFEWDALRLVVDPLDDEPAIVGRIGLSVFQWPEAVAMLGMHVFAEHRGRGYGTDALRVLCAFAFDQLNLHRISLGTWVFNEGAQALYRKVGFVVEGRERDYLYRDGRYWDAVAMGLLRSEWREHRGHPA